MNISDIELICPNEPTFVDVDLKMTHADEIKVKLQQAAEDNKIEEFLSLMEEFHKLRPHDISAKLENAKYLIASGRFKEAANILDPIVKESPDNPMATFVIGIMFYYQGKIKTCIKIFEKAMTMGINEAEPYKAKAKLFEAVVENSKNDFRTN
jgi:tetratricopeptide (TPR) repeat protein